VILACICLLHYRSVSDGQTPRRWLRHAKHYVLSRVKIEITNPSFQFVTSPLASSFKWRHWCKQVEFALSYYGCGVQMPMCVDARQTNDARALLSFAIGQPTTRTAARCWVWPTLLQPTTPAVTTTVHRHESAHIRRVLKTKQNWFCQLFTIFQSRPICGADMAKITSSALIFHLTWYASKHSRVKRRCFKLLYMCNAELVNVLVI